LIKKRNLLIPRPPQRTSKQQEKPSALRREHPALFSIFVDPGTPLNPDPIRIQSGSTTLFSGEPNSPVTKADSFKHIDDVTGGIFENIAEISRSKNLLQGYSHNLSHRHTA
jgi:hypothetical protein